MKITEHLNKGNLHHAYLIEGDREGVVAELLLFVESLGIATNGNPDFCHISIDSFKMDEALSLREMGAQKSFTTDKKFFLVSANSFTLDAQQALLKMFEEPIDNTHFFIVVPEVDALIKTLISRFYLIKNEDKELGLEEAEKFVKMPLVRRIDFIKELLAVDEDEDTLVVDGARSKALKFLNALEVVLRDKLLDKSTKAKSAYFHQIFKTREFLRQPGSAPKTLMESVALIVPTF